MNYLYLRLLKQARLLFCRFLHSCSFSRTKIRSIALQRDEEQRAMYVAEVALYAPNRFVFVDETGNDHRDCIHKCGCALRGKRCIATRLLARGKRISAIGALTYQTDDNLFE